MLICLVACVCAFAGARVCFDGRGFRLLRGRISGSMLAAALHLRESAQQRCALLGLSMFLQFGNVV